jgi:hypothetical protein
MNPIHIYYTETQIILLTGRSGVKSYDARWMGDSDLSGNVQIPDIDFCDEKYTFSYEQENEARKKYVELVVKYNLN